MERIVCSNLRKKYRIKMTEGYRLLRDAISDFLANLLNKTNNHSQSKDFIWALDGVSFSVKSGEVVGIIGRNGAGKTTLLKIFSRVTFPTEGHAILRGRLGSLLEVGTGFHPELTGRENIFLNGAVLGMSRSEIRKRFDEIVSFAEVEKFIDVPVKRYSSGMYLRLAFAVAAHLEPEILLVDEVLAVGDYNFQKKCIGKIEEIGKGGRTILFVSHNMPSVLRLCDRVIWLDQGRYMADGKPHEVVSRYLQSGLGTSGERRWEDIRLAPGDDVVRLHSVRIRDEEGKTTETIDIRKKVGIEVKYWKLKAGARPAANLHFTNEEGIQLFVSCEFTNSAWRQQHMQPGLVQSTCWIPGNFLAEGRIIVDTAVSSFNPTTIHAWERDAVSFQVIDKSDGDGVRGEFVNHLPGVIRPMLEWDYHFASLAAGAKS